MEFGECSTISTSHAISFSNQNANDQQTSGVSSAGLDRFPLFLDLQLLGHTPKFFAEIGEPG